MKLLKNWSTFKTYLLQHEERLTSIMQLEMMRKLFFRNFMVAREIGHWIIAIKIPTLTMPKEIEL